MILTGGEIYFLGERDLKSGKDTGFVKIGLVREKDARDTESRLKEHQTGNPRQLHVVKVVKTPVVERVETTLHGRFATSRVSGEWFNFISTPVDNAISEANSLSKNAKTDLGDLSRAEELKSKKSVSKIASPSSEVVKLYQDYLRLNYQLKECKDISKNVQDALYQALNSKMDIGHLLEVQKRKPSPRFSEDVFSAKYPKIYSQFSENVIEVKQRFTWNSSKGIDFDLRKLNRELSELISEAKSILRSASTKSSVAEKLHYMYLTVLTHQSPMEWKKDLVEAKVKSACGTAAGIEEICKWGRTAENRLKLDKDALKEAHPKKYEECISFTKPTEAVVLKKDRGYRL